MSSERSYTTDVEYPSMFIRNQTPIQMSAISVLNGFNHQFPTSGFTYCDFGCGNGLTLCLLAACNPQGDFYGVDINSGHLAKAKSLAEQTGLTNITFIEASFDALKDDDLPSLDFAAVAGILSWLHDNTRNKLLRYISNKLKNGGLCYLHYLSMPGASKTLATTMVTQLLAAQYDGESSTRAVRAVTELQNLFDGDNVLAINKMLPQLRETLDRQRRMNPNYLAHDILNRNPKPKWFNQVVQELSPHGLEYMGHAQPRLNCVDALFHSKITMPYRAFCEKHKDVTLREEVAGLLLNLPIRMDVFGKNIPKTGTALADGFSDLYLFNLAGKEHELKRRKVERTVSVDLFAPIYNDILEASVDQCCEVGTVFTDCAQKYGPLDTRRAFMHLLGIKKIAVGFDRGGDATNAPSWQSSKIDEYLLTSFLPQTGDAPLPSKALGSCVDVTQMDRILLTLLVTKDANLVWNLISRHNIKIRTVDNVPITDFGVFSQVMPGILSGFQQQKLPELVRLGLLT